MPETMTCYERLEKVWNLEEADRVPVSPMVITSCRTRQGFPSRISLKIRSDWWTRPLIRST
jgi:hypothetical protein